jgi:hypothetical protein
MVNDLSLFTILLLLGFGGICAVVLLLLYIGGEILACTLETIEALKKRCLHR